MKRISIIFFVLLILLFSYWRYTYILNPNFSGDPFIISIRAVGGSFEAYSSIKIKSVIAYWLMFLIGNVLLFRTVFARNRKLKIAVLFFLLLSVASAAIFGLNYFFNAKALYMLGSLLKNFILSPVFPAVTFLVLNYFSWFENET